MATRKHFVRDWMTPDPVTIPPTTTLPEVDRLMKECRVRHLPVVENSCLVGIVTLDDVREASPRCASSISLYELSYVLARLTVGEIMKSNPLVIMPDTSVEAAGRLMVEHHITGLPVVDGARVVGIITRSDIFRLFVTECELRYSLA